MITKDNVITYSYKGLAALLYLIFGKKEKIKELFVEEDVFEGSLETNASRLKKASDALADLKKIPFRYKYRDINGKIKTGTFEAYNIEQAKNYLKNEGYNLISDLS